MSKATAPAETRISSLLPPHSPPVKLASSCLPCPPIYQFLAPKPGCRRFGSFQIMLRHRGTCWIANGQANASADDLDTARSSPWPPARGFPQTTPAPHLPPHGPFPAAGLCSQRQARPKQDCAPHARTPPGCALGCCQNWMLNPSLHTKHTAAENKPVTAGRLV